MQKSLLLILCFFVGNAARSQNLQWLQTAALPEYTQPEAVRVSPTGSVYLCTSRDSVGVKVVSSLQKTFPNGTPVWTKSVRGQVVFRDVQINVSGEIFICGAFKGNVQLDAIPLTGGSSVWTGFFAMADSNGTFSWAKKLSVPNKDLIPRSMSQETNGHFYIACVGNANNSTGTSVYKADLAGNILSTKNINNDGGFVSHILTDAGGNIYLTGTCSSQASFDGNPSQLPGMDYQNMLLKYDSNFQFQWVRNREHVTFDYINKIGFSGNKVFWSLVEYRPGSAEIRKLIRFSATGTPEDSTQEVVSGADGGRPVFSMTAGGTGFLTYNIGPRFVFNLVDTGLNTVWKDSTNVVGNLTPYPIITDVAGGKIVIAATHVADTLRLANQALPNPNAGGLFLNSDVFMACWKAPASVPASIKRGGSVGGSLAELYPNPTIAYLWIKNISPAAIITCLDANGKDLFTLKGTNVIDVRSLPAGLYFLRIWQEGQEQILRFVRN